MRMIPFLLIQAMAAAKLAIDLIDQNIDGFVQVVRLLPDDDVRAGNLQPDLGPELATVVAAAGVDEFDVHADDPRVVAQQSFDLGAHRFLQGVGEVHMDPGHDDRSTCHVCCVLGGDVRLCAHVKEQDRR
jgi:hypothetical protein